MHEWIKVYDGIYVGWKCTRCNISWNQSKKPSPKYRFWYGNEPFNKHLMTCDEAITKDVMEA